MKLKISLKLGLDFTMTVLFLLSLAYPFTGNLPHELLGTALLVCFILHNLLNAGWYKGLLRGNYNARRTVLTLVNLLLLLVMMGSPIWWYTAATPVLQFLREMDFKNKKVVPFSTQGSNYGTFFEDFAARAQNARLLKGESFNNLGPQYDNAVENKIIAWLNSLS